MIEVGAASHTGLVRERNEDSAVVTERVFAVADGMGGHAGGDLASRMAIASMIRLAESPGFGEADIVTAIVTANREILNSAEEDGRNYGMGTTLTGIAVIAVAGLSHWAVFNVGDSRVYRFFDDTLTQVTTDHSEVEELVAAGHLTASEARSHPRRNVITRSLGSFPSPRVDVWVLPREAPERFVICSDGLTGELSDDAIAAVLRAEPVAQTAADRLITSALESGGNDNVTVLVVDYTTS